MLLVFKACRNARETADYPDCCSERYRIVRDCFEDG
jgi:hypothetical protein